MKLSISFFALLFLVKANASFISIYYVSERENAENVRSVFLEKYEIPSHWIRIYQAEGNDCKLKKNSEILDLCLNDKGELIELSRNQKQINALKILKKKRS